MKAKGFISFILSVSTIAACSSPPAESANDETQARLEVPEAGVAVECEVVEMYDHAFFEEALSEEEYPSVNFTKDEGGGFTVVEIGVLSELDTREGDVADVTLEYDVDGWEAVATAEIYGGIATITAPAQGKGPGLLKVEENGDKWVVARLECEGTTNKELENYDRFVTCTLASTEAGGESASLTLDLNQPSKPTSSDKSLELHGGNYSFTVNDEGYYWFVDINESSVINDKITEVECEFEEYSVGHTFCSETIAVDANLGTDDEPSMVEALSLTCTMH